MSSSTPVNTRRRHPANSADDPTLPPASRAPLPMSPFSQPSRSTANIPSQSPVVGMQQQPPPSYPIPSSQQQPPWASSSTPSSQQQQPWAYSQASPTDPRRTEASGWRPPQTEPQRSQMAPVSSATLSQPASSRTLVPKPPRLPTIDSGLGPSNYLNSNPPNLPRLNDLGPRNKRRPPPSTTYDFPVAPLQATPLSAAPRPALSQTSEYPTTVSAHPLPDPDNRAPLRSSRAPPRPVGSSRDNPKDSASKVWSPPSYRIPWDVPVPEGSYQRIAPMTSAPVTQGSRSMGGRMMAAASSQDGPGSTVQPTVSRVDSQLQDRPVDTDEIGGERGNVILRKVWQTYRSRKANYGDIFTDKPDSALLEAIESYGKTTHAPPLLVQAVRQEAKRQMTQENAKRPKRNAKRRKDRSEPGHSRDE